MNFGLVSAGRAFEMLLTLDLTNSLPFFFFFRDARRPPLTLLPLHHLRVYGVCPRVFPKTSSPLCSVVALFFLSFPLLRESKLTDFKTMTDPVNGNIAAEEELVDYEEEEVAAEGDAKAEQVRSAFFFY